eukprot:Nk52_evm17s241 gene=Nk52_evmTU17s241
MKRIAAVLLFISLLHFCSLSSISYSSNQSVNFAQAAQRTTNVNFGYFADFVRPHFAAVANNYLSDDTNYHARYITIPSGFEALRMMELGSLDCSQMGTPAFANGIARKMRIKMVFPDLFIAGEESLVVKKSLNITAPFQLKRSPPLRIATPLATTSHFHLMYSLRVFGIDAKKDVVIIEALPAQILQLWKDGSIDAAYVWDPVNDQLIADGGLSLYGSDLLASWGVPLGLVIACTDSIIAKQPKWIQLITDVLAKANDDFINNPGGLWRLGGSVFDDMLSVLYGPNPNSQSGYPWNEPVILESTKTNNLRASSTLSGHMTTTFAVTLEEQRNFMVEQKIVSEVDSSDSILSYIDTSFLDAAMAKGLASISLVARPFVTEYTTGVENCVGGQTKVYALTGDSPSLAFNLNGNVAVGKVCHFNISASTPPEAILEIEIDKVWFETPGLKLYHSAHNLSLATLTGEVTSKVIFRGLSPIVIEANFRSNTEFPGIFGAGSFGIATGQGLTANVKLIDSGCFSDSECGGAQGRGLCDTSGLCQCMHGYSGYDCSIPNCYGAQVFDMSRIPSAQSSPSTFQPFQDYVFMEEGFVQLQRNRVAHASGNSSIRNESSTDGVFSTITNELTISFESDDMQSYNGFAFRFFFRSANVSLPSTKKRLEASSLIQPRDTCDPIKTCHKNGICDTQSNQCKCNPGYFASSCLLPQCVEKNGVLNGVTGYIKSQSTEYYTRTNWVCNWFISPPKNIEVIAGQFTSALTHIKINLDVFDLEAYDDALEIYDNTGSSPVLIQSLHDKPSQCLNDADCEFRGKCVLQGSSSTGACQCDAGFISSHCSMPQNITLDAISLLVSLRTDIGNLGQSHKGVALSYEAVYPCLNSCSNKGSCVTGRCVCQKGYTGDDCSRESDDGLDTATIIIIAATVGPFALGMLILAYYIWRVRHHKHIRDMLHWKIDFEDLHFLKSAHGMNPVADSQSSLGSHASESTPGHRKSGSHHTPSLKLPARKNSERIACTSLSGRFYQYKGEVVVGKTLNISANRLSSRIRNTFQQLKLFNHATIVPFIGACLGDSLCVVYEAPRKGVLIDILDNDAINLTWMIRFSLASDMINGIQAIHHSHFGTHGGLNSAECYIDSRWGLRVTGFGLWDLQEEVIRKSTVQSNISGSGVIGVPENPSLNLRSLSRGFQTDSMSNISATGTSFGFWDLWRAPEILEEQQFCIKNIRSVEGDVWSVGVVLSELCCRLPPYHVSLNSVSTDLEAIIDRIVAGETNPFLDAEDALFHSTDPPPDALVSEVKSCFEEARKRPSLSTIQRRVKKANPSKSVSFVDNIMRMLEEYAENLEEIVSERTEELSREKDLTAELLNRTDELLSQMLPPSISERLKHGEKVEPESFDGCTIFFSDIVGFTKIAGASTPLEVVGLLNDLYTAFDSVIDHFDVYKVETIGDAYMVVSGIPHRNGIKHAGEISSLALELLHQTCSFKIHHLPSTQLQLRIGMHSGPAVAGVVGLKMPRYCLFGDTVNTASRMESGGLALRIHLSQATEKLLRELGGFILERRGELEYTGELGNEGHEESVSDPGKADEERYSLVDWGAIARVGEYNAHQLSRIYNLPDLLYFDLDVAQKYEAMMSIFRAEVDVVKH